MAVSFLKKGKTARKEAKQVDANIQRRKEEKENEIRRFWLKRGAERRITFLDGDLNDEGELNMTMYYEHNLYMNGHWRNFFVCTGNDDEPCPICEEGKTPALVAAFTVIDHTKFKDREGVVHKDVVSLLIAKRATQKLLEMQAVKRKGLAGVTFDVGRVDEDQSAAVGSVFDYVTKNPLKAIGNKFGGAEAFDYEEILGFKTPKELREMGFGKADKVGDEPGLEDADFDFDNDDSDDDVAGKEDGEVGFSFGDGDEEEDI